MPQVPAPAGLAVTVADLTAARRFYADLCRPDQVAAGCFAGLSYLALLRSGEVLVTLLQAGADTPLAGIMPTLAVESVAACEEQIRELGGTVLLAPRPHSVTGALVAVCCDHLGNQFMITEARSRP
jgi:predicted enzyme related to lactoylglutathione lyase